MNDRAGFVRAELDQDEQTVQAVEAGPDVGVDLWDGTSEARQALRAFMDRFDEERMLRQVKVIRRIVDEIVPKLDEMSRAIVGEWGDDGDLVDGEELLKLLAELYPGHPCPDCAVPAGTAHDDGCDIARCTLCGRERLICEHGVADGGWGEIWKP